MLSLLYALLNGMLSLLCDEMTFGTQCIEMVFHLNVLIDVFSKYLSVQIRYHILNMCMVSRRCELLHGVLNPFCNKMICRICPSDGAFGAIFDSKEPVNPAKKIHHKSMKSLQFNQILRFLLFQCGVATIKGLTVDTM